MKLAALFSGGKDSTFSIYKVISLGDDVKCLVTIFPFSDESNLFHYPNIYITKLQARSMNLPHLYCTMESDMTEKEATKLESLLKDAKQNFEIEGVVHGGILSEFQKNHFENICKKLDLKIISPLWKINQKEYMKELIKSQFKFIITSVSSQGLDDSWLGKEITLQNLDTLENLSSRHGFNLSFEGGEAESLVLDCPVFLAPIKIVKSNKIWDGYRGRFEITEAILDK